MRSLIAFFMIFLVAACTTPGPSPEGNEPDAPLAISAQPLNLSEDNVLTFAVTWLARDPYTHHSIYFGTGSSDDHSEEGPWDLDPVIFENIDRDPDADGSQRELTQLLEVQLFEFDVEGYLCVVAWNRSLFRERCVSVTWPGVPAQPDDIIIDFGEQSPPWASITVVPSDAEIEIGDTDRFVAVMNDVDGRQFVCVRNLESNLKGFIQVDVLGDRIEDIYISDDYAWYNNFNCDPEWTSSDESVVAVSATSTPSLILTQRPLPGEALLHNTLFVQ